MFTLCFERLARSGRPPAGRRVLRLGRIVQGEEQQVTYISGGAVAAMARPFTVDLARQKIRATAIAPGWPHTPATACQGGVRSVTRGAGWRQ